MSKPTDDNMFKMPIYLKHIHTDSRGTITCFYIDGIEYTILTTKKGYARGGCVHKKHYEYFVILKGLVEYHVYYSGAWGHQSFKMVGGQSGAIPNDTPHYLVAIEDSVTLEWGAPPEEKKTKDPEIRKIVDQINRIMDKVDKPQ